VTKREYAIHETDRDTGKVTIHGHTENERHVEVWRKRKMNHQKVVWREIGEWQLDTHDAVGGETT